MRLAGRALLVDNPHYNMHMPSLLNTQSALIGQLTQARASSPKLNVSLKLRTCVTRCVMSQDHLTKVFEEKCFLWERGASVGVAFVTFKIFYTQNQIKH